MFDIREIEMVSQETAIPLYAPYSSYISGEMERAGIPKKFVSFNALGAENTPLDDAKAAKLARIMFQGMPQQITGFFPDIIVSHMQPESVQNEIRKLPYDERFIDYCVEYDLCGPKRTREEIVAELQTMPSAEAVKAYKELFGGEALDTIDGLLAACASQRGLAAKTEPRDRQSVCSLDDREGARRMSIKAIPLDERIRRYEEGSSVAPDYAAAIVEPFARMTLSDYMDEHAKMISGVVVPLVDRGVTEESTLAETAAAIETMRGKCDDHILFASEIAFTAPLVEAAREMQAGVKKATNNDYADAIRPEDVGPDDSSKPQKVPLARRIAKYELSRSNRFSKLLSLSYGDYLLGFEMIASDQRVSKDREWLRETWSVNPQVDMMSIMLKTNPNEFACDPRRLYDVLIVHPLAAFAAMEAGTK